MAQNSGSDSCRHVKLSTASVRVHGVNNIPMESLRPRSVVCFLLWLYGMDCPPPI